MAHGADEPAHDEVLEGLSAVRPEGRTEGGTKEEVDELICWLTGYDAGGLKDQLARETDFETFFAEAPRLHPNRGEIKGLICGYRVEEIADPFEQKLRQLDKLIDELAKGKAMEKIKRG